MKHQIGCGLGTLCLLGRLCRKCAAQRLCLIAERRGAPALHVQLRLQSRDLRST